MTVKKFNIALKNFAAGRKALFKRILLYAGSAIAVYEAVSIVINESNAAQLLSGYPVFKSISIPF